MKNLTPRQRMYARILLDCIKKERRTITYGELANFAGVSPQSVGRDLGELSRCCHRLGLPPISGMVVNAQSQLPDFEGFGGLCNELGEYQQFLASQYEKLVKQCLNDIHQCTQWQIFETYIK